MIFPIIISIVATELGFDYIYEVGDSCESITYHENCQGDSCYPFYEVNIPKEDSKIRIYERCVISTTTKDVGRDKIK